MGNFLTICVKIFEMARSLNFSCPGLTSTDEVFVVSPLLFQVPKPCY